jgi:hypothetical protein
VALSRRKLLGLGGAGAAAAFGLGACGGDDGNGKAGSPARGGSREQDIEIVNFALTLEFIEAALYAKAQDSGFFSGRELEFIRRFGAHEHDHIEALTAAIGKLGGKPPLRPKTTFPLDDRPTIVKTAYRLENLGAAAYLGQVPRIHDNEILAAVLSIHSVEGRHATTWNKTLGKEIAPTGAFATPTTMHDALAVANLYITT